MVGMYSSFSHPRRHHGGYVPLYYTSRVPWWVYTPPYMSLRVSLVGYLLLYMPVCTPLGP